MMPHANIVCGATHELKSRVHGRPSTRRETMAARMSTRPAPRWPRALVHVDVVHDPTGSRWSTWMKRLGSSAWCWR